MIVIIFIIVAQRLLIIAQIKISEFNICLNAGNKGFRDLFVEEIRARIRQSSAFKIGELVNEIFVLRKILFKNRHIKNEPFMDIGDYEMFYFLFGSFVPTFPVFGFTFPFVDQLLLLLLSGAVRT